MPAFETAAAAQRLHPRPQGVPPTLEQVEPCLLNVLALNVLPRERAACGHEPHSQQRVKRPRLTCMHSGRCPPQLLPHQWAGKTTQQPGLQGMHVPPRSLTCQRAVRQQPHVALPRGARLRQVGLKGAAHQQAVAVLDADDPGQPQLLGSLRVREGADVGRWSAACGPSQLAILHQRCNCSACLHKCHAPSASPARTASRHTTFHC